jgi:uncharacterized protein YrzB (UPF0473 family)
MHKISKIIFSLTFLFLGGHVNAAEYFYLTHYAPIVESETNKPPPVDDPSYAPTIIYVDGERFGLVERDCNGEIEKTQPFSQSRAFVSIVDDAGGDVAFRKFLKIKIHTDMTQWKKRYLVKFPDKKTDASSCELLQQSMIFRSENEIIITDTTYFYRFSKGTKSAPPKDYTKSSSDFDG